MFLDRSSLEVFAGRPGAEGLVPIAATVFAQPAADAVALFAEGGTATLERADVYPLKSIWPPRADDADAKEPLGVHLWGQARLEVGQTRWLGARAWPGGGHPLAWSVDRPDLVELVETDTPGWVTLEARGEGEAVLTAAVPGSDARAECRVYVVPNTFRESVGFRYSDAEWRQTRGTKAASDANGPAADGGLTHVGDGHRSLLSESHARRLSFSATVTLNDADARGGLFICSGGGGRVGSFVRLDGPRGRVVLGRYEGEPEAVAEHAPLEPGRPYRLTVHHNTPDHPGRLVVELDGVPVLDVPQPANPEWGGRTGLAAEGRATFQDVELVHHVE